MIRTAIIGASILAVGAAQVSANVATVASKTRPAQIICRSSDPTVRHTADWCRSFLKTRGYAVASKPTTGPTWVLKTIKNCQVASDVKFLTNARSDAYILTIQSPGTIGIIGRNAQGVRSGIARLIALSRESGSQLVANETTERRSPFFATRRLELSPTGRIAQGTSYSDSLWTNWSDDRIRAYVEQIWLMGYNSIEAPECRGYRGVFSDEELAKNITPKIRVLLSTAKDYGLETSLFIWGQSIFVEGQSMCWNDASEHKQMETEYTRLARTYGDVVDHIVVHVGDPGGCSRNGCDAYKTTQAIAVFLSGQFTRVNPKCTTTLSTWANFGFWKGRPGVKLMDETFSPKSMGIALHRWYDADKAAAVKLSGRPLDIWGWYLSDYEMELDMLLAMRRLDNYYTALPDSASSQVRAISTEMNFQGWPNVINAYVAAQKMWSPKRPLEQIEREFASATYGEANADAVVKAYQACEGYVVPGRFAYFIPETDCPPVVFGTPDYNKQLKDALASANNVSIHAHMTARFTGPVSPAQYWNILNTRLNLLSVLSSAQQRMNQARAAGATKKELDSISAFAVQKAQPYSTDIAINYIHLK